MRLTGRELQHLEEHPAQLRHRVDDERLAGVRVDLRLQLVALLLEIGAHLVEELAVEPDAEVLHRGEHADERSLDVLVQRAQLAGVEHAAQRLTEPEHCCGAPAGVVAGRVTVEVEGPLGLLAVG